MEMRHRLIIDVSHGSDDDLHTLHLSYRVVQAKIGFGAFHRSENETTCRKMPGFRELIETRGNIPGELSAVFDSVGYDKRQGQ